MTEKEEILEVLKKPMTLGEKATGTIQAGPEQPRAREVIDAVKIGRFHVSTEMKIPFMCIDGRLGGLLGPNSAGGSETLYVADDLTGGAISGEGTTDEGYQRMLAFLAERGLPVGGHTDEHAEGEKSGCGANDRLMDIYAFIHQESHHLQAVAKKLGVAISDEAMAGFAAHAGAKLPEDFSAATDLLATLREKAGAEAAPALRGGHKEVVTVINTKTGTTLDRTELAKECGEEYEAFNVDVWSFEAAARAISAADASQEEIDQKVAAMVIYNLATAYVLCGPDMPVVVL